MTEGAPDVAVRAAPRKPEPPNPLRDSEDPLAVGAGGAAGDATAASGGRRTAPGWRADRGHAELVVAVLAILLVSIPWDAVFDMTGQGVCPFFRLTHLPCPGCGLTRSFVAVGNGDLRTALDAHLFGPLLYATGAAFVAHGVTERATRGPLRPRWLLRAWSAWLQLLFAAMAVFGAIRLVRSASS